MTIELIYFEGCPNAEAARTNLRAALTSLGKRPEWTEWDLTSPSSPDHVRAFGSPTILVNGTDVTGVVSGAAALACRSDPVPTAGAIGSALSEEVSGRAV